MPKFDPRQLSGKARHIAFADDKPPPDLDVTKMQRQRQALIREQMSLYD